METYFSPAKVNLLLKVVGRRSDGYHNIVSIVDPISLGDELQVEALAENLIVVEDDQNLLPSGKANTVYRAAMLLKETCGVQQGVRVLIRKNIPIGAGLGGPSSNAATVLKALTRAWNVTVSPPQLSTLGATIGADVPLFLYGKPCIMRGIGEQIAPVELPRMWYLIIYPRIVLHTREVYEGLKIPLTFAQNDIILSAQFSSVFDVARVLENDLERVAFSLHPEIHTAKERLQNAGAIGSLMSGSGSSVFGVFATEEGARGAVERVSDLGSVFVAHSL